VLKDTNNHNTPDTNCEEKENLKAKSHEKNDIK